MDDGFRHVEHWQDFRTGRAKDLGVVWTLGKGTHTATCVLQGHPLGTEGRVLFDGDVHRTQVFRDHAAMIDQTAAWRGVFEGKGWS